MVPKCDPKYRTYGATGMDARYILLMVGWHPPTKVFALCVPSACLASPGCPRSPPSPRTRGALTFRESKFRGKDVSETIFHWYLPLAEGRRGHAYPSHREDWSGFAWATIPGRGRRVATAKDLRLGAASRGLDIVPFHRHHGTYCLICPIASWTRHTRIPSDRRCPAEVQFQATVCGALEPRGTVDLH